MHRVSELLRGRGVRIIRAERLVVRLVSVRAPVPFDLARSHVDDRDAMVAVAIGHVGLVARFIEEDLGDFVECPVVVAAGACVGEPELFDELAIPTEHENVTIVGAVAADPEVPFAVGRDAVVRFGPLVAFAGSTPAFDQVAFRIELENRRRRHTAVGHGRILRGVDFLLVERGFAAMDDEDVVAAVDADANRHTEQPMVGQRLGPHRVDFEPRRLDGILGLRSCRLLQHGLGDAERHEHCQ